MTSKIEREAFVWIWLPGNTEPVVAGRLVVDEFHDGAINFNYGKSYLDRIADARPAIPIYEPELPLRSGQLPLLNGLKIPSCIRDAAPDAWGRRVILNKMHGFGSADLDTNQLDELTYLLESGSDRIGALDFQRSLTDYELRPVPFTALEDLVEMSSQVEQGIPVRPELDQALFHGSSIGGAQPKALMEDEGGKYIAKFPSSTHTFSYVKAEFIAMRLAKLAGIDVAEVSLTKAVGKDVLLIKRFDRISIGGQWSRRALVSALTLFGLDEMHARHASYEQLAEIIRARFKSPKATLRELFSRLVFNILCGNTDDHARNHAAFWDGRELTLTPAYDICPQNRLGGEASQAMKIVGNLNLSQLKSCLLVAPHFLLSEAEAKMICDSITASIKEHWDAVCDEAQLSVVDRNLLWHRQFLNPFAFYD